METDIEPFRVISNLEVCICIAAALVTYLVVGLLGNRGLSVASAATVGVLLSCAGICWPLRMLRSFWFVAAGVLLAHVIALMFVNWSFAKGWTGLTIMPFMAADTLVTLSLVYAAFRLTSGQPTALFAPE